MLQNPVQDQAAPPAPAYPARTVTVILVASVCYLSVLSFLNARGIGASAAMVGLCEALIFAACLTVLARHLPFSTVTLSFCICAWFVFTWMIRQSPDVKSLRDLIIPILFLSLGRYVADAGFADRCLKLIVGILIAIGLFEITFADAFGRLFNTLSFYGHLGGINEKAAISSGQLLTLNSFRPEGIGRTILPQVFGSHRASSVLMEPVSLGNFAVIALAWALSKPWQELRKAPWLVLGAVLLVTLADSRFGLLMGSALLVLRCVPLLVRLAPTLPVLSFALVIGVAAFMPSLGDNFLGRVTQSGIQLMHFDWSQLLGLRGPLPDYGDMGFAYVLSRFGAPLSIALVFLLFLMPMAEPRGVRFRALIVLYIFASLAISGTSVFALKTAGILWFLFGVLCTVPGRGRLPAGKAQPDNAVLHPPLSPAPYAAGTWKGSHA